MTIHPAWEELPLGLWGSIFQRLPLVDRVHASAVCKQWSSILKQIPRPVWILLSPDDETDDKLHGGGSICCFDMGEGTTRKLNLPESMPEGVLIGSSRGWLVLENDELQFFLLDPISRVQISLPPFMKEEPIYTDKIEISCGDASQSVVAASLNQGKSLALCKPKDQIWTLFEGQGVANGARYLSFLFYNGILNALIVTPEDNATTYQVQTHSLKLADDDDDDDDVILLKLISFPTSDIIYPTIGDGDASDIDISWSIIPFMVESNGELLLVLKFIYNDNPLQISHTQVAAFQVLKVEASDDELCLTTLSTLDDQALFIGVERGSLGGESFCKNCIYFLGDSCVKPGQDLERVTDPPSGVFHLSDGRIEPSWFPGDHYSSWFFPNIKIGGFN